MIRTIYHGASRIVRAPAFSLGSTYNDFGMGFYCTDSRELAAQWAAGDGSDGFVNSYRIDDTGLRILDLGSPQYCLLHWLGILLNFREFDTLNSRAYQARDYIRTAFAISQQNYDCIIGPRADNVNFTFAQSFLNGEISYRLLSESIRIGVPDRQFVLRSNRAFDRLLFTGYDTVKSIRESPARLSREHKALEHLSRAMLAAPGRKNSQELYIAQIMDENIREYDPRLR